MDKFSALQEYFGYSTFREGQGEIIDSILQRRDALAIMPTGAGKSLCYQIPALILEGVTVVVSPLISLMQDQVGALVQAGIRAAYINSSLTPRQYFEALRRAEAGLYKIIYVAPERLLQEEFLNLSARMGVSMVTVDEAHCVSQWGHEFRPSYMEIPQYINALPSRPIVSAFTATATLRVMEDIQGQIGLTNPFVRKTGFDRENLYFQVLRPENKLRTLFEILKSRAGQSGIIYCATRKDVESVTDALRGAGLRAGGYHGGMENAGRKRVQEDFLFDRINIMVATNAFGMGIDKSNVSYVIHHSLPKNIESYYQEAGRAGRDGDPAVCVLLYSSRDIQVNRFLIDNGREGGEAMTEQQREDKRLQEHRHLDQMIRYCNTTGCLRNYILRYFGEDVQGDCGRCGNCDTVFMETDITREAKAILRCVLSLKRKKWPFGRAMVVHILRGSKQKKIIEFGLDTLQEYGVLQDLDDSQIRTVLEYLVESGALRQKGDSKPVLLPGEAAEMFLDIETVMMKQAAPRPEKKNRRALAPDTAHASQTPISEEPIDPADPLLADLKKLRRELAKIASVPAYHIFPNAALYEMCRLRPVTRGAFLEVPGVGAVKLEKFGDQFLKVIQRHLPSINCQETPTSLEAGRPWTDDELQKLMLEKSIGISPAQMASLHGRGIREIQDRLTLLE